MGGMEMMLKSMGFDVAEFQSFIGGMKELMLKFNNDLEAIKIKQNELEQNQRAILAAVVKPEFLENNHGR